MTDAGYFKDIRSTILSVVISILSLSTMIIASLALSEILLYFTDETNENLHLIHSLFYLGGAFLCFGASVFIGVFRDPRKCFKFYLFGSMIVCAITATLLFILHEYEVMGIVACVILVLLLFARQIVVLIYKHNVRSIVATVITFALLFVLLVVNFAGYAYFSIIEVCALLIFLSFCFILIEAFSRIHFATLKDILRRTYALEILLGLITLIVACSFLFFLFEDDMSYPDALWFSFAIVTTIGFGDVTVKSVVSRILSVILGIYGIIVVALITSIIVNFYNETKYIGKREDDEENNEEKEIDNNENSEEKPEN